MEWSVLSIAGIDSSGKIFASTLYNRLHAKSRSAFPLSLPLIKKAQCGYHPFNTQNTEGDMTREHTTTVTGESHERVGVPRKGSRNKPKMLNMKVNGRAES